MIFEIILIFRYSFLLYELAFKRQYNNLVALFDNWDMYGEALETSMNAAGTLQNQQEIAMDKLAKDLNVTKSRVNMWENNGTVPRSDMLIKLSKYFEVSSDFLIGDSGS